MNSPELFSIAFLIIGSLLLYFGADSLVKGSTRLAINLGITPIIIGLTVVAFGTSAPELIVSLSAGYQGNAEIALGNVIGSNICNIALILGLSSLIRPVEFHLKYVNKDFWIMIIASIAVLIMSLDGDLDMWDGAILTLGIVSYVLYNIKKSKDENLEIELEEVTGKTKFKDKNIFHVLLLIVGLVILMMGANLFLEGAVNIAKYLGLSNVIIGLTIVALGTSLPELAVSVVASIKKESDISLGNVIGSNIFNLLMILGVTSIFFPIGANDISLVDIGIMIFTSLIIVPLGMRGNKFSRLDGAFLLLIYIGYMYYLFTYGSLPQV
ncbi:MAG: calcium/sodium antiporter [Candidatus Kapabacteria bacterium]|nr:calcium/sodium antiporter [Ignavibacteriota bacterium]MCW5884251.1 calcium/sodium antiporter [Candidatus Kapabacteria bacterium]